MNQWDIPEWLVREVRNRDSACVYCGTVLLDAPLPDGSRMALGTWEHIINDERIITRENIARCCSPCNSSKGAKRLSDWMHSDYCKERGISGETVAEVVKQALGNDA